MNSNEPSSPLFAAAKHSSEPFKYTRSRRPSNTFIRESPTSDSPRFRKAQSSSNIPKTAISNEKELTDKRGSTDHASQKKDSQVRGYWNHFEVYEKTFDPTKVFTKRGPPVRSDSPPPLEFAPTRARSDPPSSTRCLLNKKLVPLSNPSTFALEKDKLETVQNTLSPLLKKESKKEVPDLPHSHNPNVPLNLRRVFPITGAKGSTDRTENSDRVFEVSPPTRPFSFKFLRPQEVQSEKSEKVKDDYKFSEPLDKDSAVVRAISMSSDDDDNEEDESDDSFVDSLIEDNPYEESNFHFQRSLTLRSMHTHIRDSRKYEGIRFILFPDDKFRKFWDIVILFALLYTAILMPVRLAFIDNPLGWLIVDWIIDGTFLIDICVNFCSAYFDAEDILITNRKKIFFQYLFGWFIIDFICIFPFQLLNLESENTKYNNMFKLARLPRLYRLLKIIKLVRMFKVIKDQQEFQDYMKDTVKLGAAYERLLLCVISMILFCHIFACVWFILVTLNETSDSWIDAYGLQALDDFDQYIASLYYVIQTVVTVGYGDMAPQIYEERLIACFYMFIGVFFYSVFIGFLSSLVNDIENLSQKFSYKLRILNKLKKEYGLSISFTKQLISAIKYENKQKLDYKHFINELPVNLGVELSYRMYSELIESIPFFQNRSKSFIAAIGPLLRPMKILKDEYIFMEGDPADELFFIKTGKIAYVLPKYHNFKFLKVREGYFFGEVDLLFYGEIRKYCAMAVKDCEFYVLNKKDFKKIFLVEFRDIGTELYMNAHPRKVRTRRVNKEAQEICKAYQGSPKNQGRRLSRQRLSLFRSEMQDNDDEDSEESDENENKPGILPDIAEEEDDEAEPKLLAPETQPAKSPTASMPNRASFTVMKAALAFQKGLSPFTKRSSFGEALAAQKEKLVDESKVNYLSERMESLEGQLNKVVALTGALSKKLTEKDRFRKTHHQPSQVKSNNINRVTIIKSQPRNLTSLIRLNEPDVDDDFINQVIPSTMIHGLNHQEYGSGNGEYRHTPNTKTSLKNQAESLRAFEM